MEANTVGFSPIRSRAIVPDVTPSGIPGRFGLAAGIAFNFAGSPPQTASSCGNDQPGKLMKPGR